MRIGCLMSGGVDSSVSALLLKNMGYEVVGFTLKFLSNGSRCCDMEDIYYARRVANQIKIPHYVLDLNKEFERVINYFVEEYIQGRTPNPCAFCNREIKFGKFFEKLNHFGIEYIATGHYAQIVNTNGEYFLKKGVDKNKDQSYFIATIKKELLPHIILPIGNYTKNEVREIAYKYNLKTKNKNESQDVCFIKKIKSCPPGNIIDKHGNIIGRHSSIAEFTIGQRRKIRANKLYYVIRIDPKENIVVVGDKEDLYSKKFIANKVNWLSNVPIECDVKIRYKQQEAKATIYTTKNDTVLVEFKEPQLAITPGQLAVFYDNDKVIGSAWIKEVIK